MGRTFLACDIRGSIDRSPLPIKVRLGAFRSIQRMTQLTLRNSHAIHTTQPHTGPHRGFDSALAWSFPQPSPAQPSPAQPPSLSHMLPGSLFQQAVEEAAGGRDNLWCYQPPPPPRPLQPLRPNLQQPQPPPKDAPAHADADAGARAQAQAQAQVRSQLLATLPFLRRPASQCKRPNDPPPSWPRAYQDPDERHAIDHMPWEYETPLGQHDDRYVCEPGSRSVGRSVWMAALDCNRSKPTPTFSIHIQSG